MNNAVPYLVAALLGGLVLGGCTDSSRPTATGKGSIRGVHAIVDAPEAAFLIEERSLGSIGYKGVSSTVEFDDLSYRFNFDSSVPGDTSNQRIASTDLAIVADTDYVFVLTGTYNDAGILVWESPQREWETADDVFEFSVGHLATQAGAIDVYFAAPGTVPVSGEARGTLSFGERLASIDVEEGSYRVILTPANDPSSILFHSTTQTISAQTAVLFTINDADPSITSAISVRRVNAGGGSTELGDRDSPPTRRFFHAAFGTGNVDVYVDDDFAMPIASDLAYGTWTADIPVPAGASNYTYTAAGNTGAVLAEEEDLVIVANTRVTSFLMGPPGDAEVLNFVNDRRPVIGTSKVRVVQVSENFDTVDVYLRTAGSDIADVTPSFPNFGSGLSSDYARLAPGAYDFTVTERAEKTVIEGPVALDLAAADITEIALIDNADPAQLDVVVYD